MTYHRRYSGYPEIVKKLDKIKYMIHSIGGLNTSVKIDFDLDFIGGSGSIDGFSLYVGESYEIDGLVHDIINPLENTTKKVVAVFDRIKLDKNLNFNRTSENFFSDEPMVAKLNYEHIEGNFEYELMFLFEIIG